MSKRRKRMPVFQGECATMERQQQQDGVITEVIIRDQRGHALLHRHKARCECVLDSYLVHGKVNEAEYEAGMKFRRAYLRAVLRVKVDDDGDSGCYDPEMATLMVPISEQILREAYNVLTPAQEAIVIAVCGHDANAGNTDRIETLHRGLERLAECWKIK